MSARRAVAQYHGTRHTRQLPLRFSLLFSFNTSKNPTRRLATRAATGQSHGVTQHTCARSQAQPSEEEGAQHTQPSPLLGTTPFLLASLSQQPSPGKTTACLPQIAVHTRPLRTRINTHKQTNPHIASATLIAAWDDLTSQHAPLLYAFSQSIPQPKAGGKQTPTRSMCIHSFRQVGKTSH